MQNSSPLIIGPFVTVPARLKVTFLAQSSHNQPLNGGGETEIKFVVSNCKTATKKTWTIGAAGGGPDSIKMTSYKAYSANYTYSWREAASSASRGRCVS